MINEIDLLMEYNKDLSYKEAEKIVEDNKKNKENEPLEPTEQEISE